MGYADVLIEMGIPYNSEEALNLAEEIMSFINRESKIKSIELAEMRGAFPNFKDVLDDNQFTGNLLFDVNELHLIRNKLSKLLAL